MQNLHNAFVYGYRYALIAGENMSEFHAFDYIAIPKGQMPGGPVQSSAGDWFLCIAPSISVDAQVQMIIDAEKMRNAHNRATADDIQMAIDVLLAMKEGRK